MTDRPVIFSGPMVRALLAGTKTQTRRLITPGTCTVLGNRVTAKSPAWTGLKFDRAEVRTTSPTGVPRPHLAVPWVHPEDEARGMAADAVYRVDPIIEVGDRLWVRESFVRYYELDGDDQPCSEPLTCCRADGWPLSSWYDRDREETRDAPPWRSPIHMPRALSRFTLTVTEVRVQRLHDISEEDARAGGCRDYGAGFTPDPGDVSAGLMDTAAWAFQGLWCRLHGPQSWEANPWVAAISFSTTPANIDTLPEQP